MDDTYTGAGLNSMTINSSNISGEFTLDQFSGAITAGGELFVGLNPSSTGTYSLSGSGTSLTVGSGGDVIVGYGGAGAFTQSGGAVSGLESCGSTRSCG